MKKLAWSIIVLLALLVGLIPLTYLTDAKQGYLEMKAPETLKNIVWQVGFVTHIAAGAIAIGIGWLQFSRKLLVRKTRWHRAIGKTYIVTALFCSGAGIFIGFYANGGPLAMAGFICGGCVYFYTTLKGYLLIREKKLVRHQEMMTYSYAACLGAVTLRIYMPLSTLLPYEYDLVYNFVAWLSWLVNLAIAYGINRARQRHGRFATT